jgi:hypothetical protein
MAKFGLSWFARHKILTALILIIIIAAIASSASGSNKNSSNNSPSNTKNSQPAASNNNNQATQTSAAKIGTAVRDGKFEFTVNSVDCNKAEVVSPDSDALRKSAQGQFCVVVMTVKNIGSQQQGFFSTNQKLLDASSKQYSSDDVATAYATPTSQQSNWSQINPGNSIDATVVFYLTKGVSPSFAELHDSAFSGGAKVSLQ